MPSKPGIALVRRRTSPYFSHTTRFLYFFGFLISLSLSGCMLFKRPVPTVEARRVVFRIHVVKKSGETLASISDFYTGKSANWQLVLAANPGLNHRQIKVGQRIRIPLSMLKSELQSQKKPQPQRTAVPKSVAKPESQKPVTPMKEEERIPVIRDPAAPTHPEPSSAKQHESEVPVTDYDPKPYVPETNFAPPLKPAPAPSATPDARKIEEQKLKQRYELLMEIIENENDSSQK